MQLVSELQLSKALVPRHCEGVTYLSATATQPPGVPSTSNLNTGGTTRSNLALVPIGPDGRIWLFNAAGLTDVIVDVEGFVQA